MRPSNITPRDLEHMLSDATEEPKPLLLSLLEEITDGFSDKQQIGSGGFAVVYKGKLQNRTVAVKRLSNMCMDEKVFHREIQCLMIAKHKNIVRFLGYCADRQGIMAKYEEKLVMADVHERLLCFEYLPKGSLHDYIIDTSSGLQWRDCYHIIKGIQGLHYLHHNNIVHLDLKPGNILLDCNLVAKISDFGLSRCFEKNQSRIITTNIPGTLGYLAPEFCNGQITYKFDIYSLGVLIIEMLTGMKGYQDVDKVVESWSNRLEESNIEVQLEQVRVCFEIAIECTNFNPAKRPDTQHIICRLDETESMDRYIETGVITSRQQNNSEQLISTMRALWSSYQQLNPNIRRCIEFCSIFSVGSKLRKGELVRLWIAHGFVKTSGETEDMEDIASGYIQELVSSSFLQPIKTSSDTEIFTIHDVLHDMLDKVAGNCFRIENASSHRGEGWEGDVPPDIQHLFIQNYDGELITGKVLGLENLRTLIVYVVGKDTLIEKEVIESICQRLPKLRVLAIAFGQEHDPIEQPKEFSFPESIGELKYLSYLAFRAKSRYFKITLPSTVNELHHIQLLDFGNGKIVEFTFAELVNLRHIFCWPHVKLPYVGRLSSLQTLPGFEVSNEQGCELEQLRDLNKLRGKLRITGLENVNNKGQAFEANLAAKQLTELRLECGKTDAAWCRPEVEADVLEGLCPPVGLHKLELLNFVGQRYPDWMVSIHGGGPKDLQELHISGCRLSVPPSGFDVAFPHLRVLQLFDCSWDGLPGDMEHLTSLKKLRIHTCESIQSLPSLPQSLETFILIGSNREFRQSCTTSGNPNWQKLEHIPDKRYFRL